MLHRFVAQCSQSVPGAIEMSKNLSVSAPQKKSRPTGRLEQSLKIRLELGRDRFKPGIEVGTDARTDDHIEMPAAIRPYSIAFDALHPVAALYATRQ
jgi:hypothetical protein